MESRRSLDRHSLVRHGLYHSLRRSRWAEWAASLALHPFCLRRRRPKTARRSAESRGRLSAKPAQDLGRWSAPPTVSLEAEQAEWARRISLEHEDTSDPASAREPHVWPAGAAPSADTQVQLKADTLPQSGNEGMEVAAASPNASVPPSSARDQGGAKSGALGKGAPGLKSAAQPAAAPTAVAADSAPVEQVVANATAQPDPGMTSTYGPLADAPDATIASAVRCSPYELPRGSTAGEEQCYLALDPTSFNVRDRHYMSDGKKAPSAGGAAELLAVELFRSKNVVEDIGTRPDSPSHTLHLRTASSLESVFVVNMIIPGASGVFQLVLYFGVLDTGAAGAAHELLCAFRSPATSDQFRNSRFKLIPAIQTGPWLVKKAVGHTPAILGKQLKQRFLACPGIFQVSVDCNSSPAAGRIVSMVKSQCKHLAVDLAFMLEAQHSSELPERVLGCVRISHCSLSSSAIPMFVA